MMTELLRPGYSNISCTEDQCAFSGVAMLTELEVLIEKTDPIVICVCCILEHVCYEPFSLKKLQIWKVSYFSCSNFVYCLKFTSLRPDSSK